MTAGDAMLEDRVVVLSLLLLPLEISLHEFTVGSGLHGEGALVGKAADVRSNKSGSACEGGAALKVGSGEVTKVGESSDDPVKANVGLMFSITILGNISGLALVDSECVNGDGPSTA